MQPTPSSPPGGIAESINRALVWLDGLRDRRGFSTAVAIAIGISAAVLWTVGQRTQPEAIDHRIPSILERDEAAASSTSTLSNQGGAASVQPTTIGTEPPDSAAEMESPPAVVVHVSGAVNLEGLVELPAGSRLADAIDAAGGETELADIHRLNLATPLVDGMHIRVPRRGDLDDDPSQPLVELAPIAGGAPSAATAGSASKADQKVNVNTAGAVELERLPGVGPATASAIIAWRDDNGRFETIDDLLAVPGIGPAKLAAMEEQVAL